MSKELKDYTPKELERILKIAEYMSTSLQDGNTQHPKSINANDLHAALNPSPLPSDEELWEIHSTAKRLYSNTEKNWSIIHRAIYASALENAKQHPDRIDEMLKELKER